MRRVLLAIVVVASCGRVNFDREPVDSPLLGDRVVALAAGGAFTCALRTSKTVWCWGSNSAGQLGDGTTTTRSTPAPVAKLSNAVQLSVSSEPDAQHACARDSAGAVACWGSNFRGALGNGSTTSASEPQPVTTLVPVASVSVGGLHTCAMEENGAVWCWGHNTEAQLGTVTPLLATTPQRVPGIPNATFVAAAHRHSCVIAADAVWCWGGLLDEPPARVVGSDGSLRAIDDGLGNTCYLRTTGVVECFGDNSSGQLGDGTVAPRAAPATPTGLPVVRDLTASLYNTCARTADGAAYCWGRNDRGQLAGASSDAPATLPVELVTLGAVELLTMGLYHACAVRDGEVLCWGDNASGQLGADPSALPMSATPVRVELP